MTVDAAAPAPVFDRTIIDYLRVTSEDGKPLHDVLRGPIETLPNGLAFYPHVERDGFGTLYAAGGPHGGRFMLQLSGEPLASWRAEKTERELVAHLASHGVRCTRLDIARDTSGDWTPYRLRQYLDAERHVSKWRKRPVYWQQQCGGLSVNLGSRLSDFMARVYDKKAEAVESGKPCEHDRLSRWELEIKGDLAPTAFRSVARLPLVLESATGVQRLSLGRVHAAWLGQRLRLTTRAVDREAKEQAHTEVDPAWTAFLSESDGSELLPDPDTRTVAEQAARFAEWFVTSNAGSLAAFVELAGPDGLAELLRVGAAKLSAKHRLLIERSAETRAAVRGILGL